MPSFLALLHHALMTSGMSQRALERQCGLSAGAISKALRGKFTLEWQRGPQLARALGLRGEAARAFAMALALANAPPPVRRLVRELQRQLRDR